MKKYYSYILADGVIKWAFIVSLIAIVFSLGAVIIFYSYLPPFIPLFNKMPWGYSRIGTRSEFFIPCAIAFLFFIVNIFLSSVYYSHAAIISRILSYTTLLFSFCLLLFTIQIILLIK